VEKILIASSRPRHHHDSCRCCRNNRQQRRCRRIVILGNTNLSPSQPIRVRGKSWANKSVTSPFTSLNALVLLCCAMNYNILNNLPPRVIDTFAPAGVRAILGLAGLPPLPRNERHFIPIILPRLSAVPSILETARICKVPAVSALFVLPGLVGPPLFRFSRGRRFE
jgi:hypothetical protein